MPQPRSRPCKLWSSAISTRIRPMRQAVELKGRPASDGIFAGPVFFLEGIATERRPAGAATAETKTFDEAIAAAIAGLAALVETAQGEGADMLSFQIAMLEDDALLEPA